MVIVTSTAAKAMAVSSKPLSVKLLKNHLAIPDTIINEKPITIPLTIPPINIPIVFCNKPAESNSKFANTITNRKLGRRTDKEAKEILLFCNELFAMIIEYMNNTIADINTPTKVYTYLATIISSLVTGNTPTTPALLYFIENVDEISAYTELYANIVATHHSAKKSSL